MPPPDAGGLADYVRLVRLPNVFTALADAAMGFLVVSAAERNQEVGRLLGVMLASGALYLSGMAWNDFFDRQLDRQQRPERPIPSGRITPRRAAQVAGLLMGLGVVLGILALARNQAAWWAPAVVVALAALIVAYNALLKRGPWGPVAMGGCRGLNIVMAGLAAAATLPADVAIRPLSLNLLIALAMTIYVAGITWFARTEGQVSRRGMLAGALGVMLAGLLLLAVHPWWLGTWGQSRFQLTPPVVWPLMLGLLILAPARRWVQALARPEPQVVQIGVKQALMFLIVLDAALVLAWRAPSSWSLMILALWLPAYLLGRSVPST